VSEEDLKQGSLYPALPRIREVSAHIAAAVAEIAYNRGFATGQAPEDLLAYVQSQMYDPHYWGIRDDAGWRSSEETLGKK
jgi:malate dehydrogenase (oxaloacetate-decarboxylating)(NADP+)